MPSLADVVAALERRYDPARAEPWDAVGLVCGDPAAEVSRIHFAVDPVEVVAGEAIGSGAQLLVTHHPLFLGGTTSVAATTPKGRVAHALVTSGVGLFVAHTNADVASPGVSDALADALGVRDLSPLAPSPEVSLDKLVTFVPVEDVDRVVDALAAAGAGAIGDYSRCAYLFDGTGTFLPGPRANPTTGERGRVERVAETRVEMVMPRPRRSSVIRALLAVHPYEEPAYDVFELAALPGQGGLGRIGGLAEPTTLAAFTRHAATMLPATVAGVRAAGDPRLPVQTVAVCGGSGGELAEAAAAAGADVLLTADLKHHRSSEAVADLGIGLVDASHWSTEQPWLDAAAELLVGDLRAAGTTVEVTVSPTVTDPWTLHARRPEES